MSAGNNHAWVSLLFSLRGNGRCPPRLCTWSVSDHTGLRQASAARDLKCIKP
uniref:Uncharacterized protein n=1 Tax=Anguilla anguilla TaxID=7936 RepID=A0A0E9Q4M9_ANGAN